MVETYPDIGPSESLQDFMCLLLYQSRTFPMTNGLIVECVEPTKEAYMRKGMCEFYHYNIPSEGETS